MIVQTIKVNDCAPQTIVIGRRGTYDTLQIAFDLSYLVESYGNGVAVLAVKRSQDESAYPAVVTQENNTLTWTVSETDTYYVGSGECQLMWYVDGGLAKTIIYPMVVMRDILQTAEEPPDGYENWVEHLTALGAETQQNAQNAAQSASEAEQAKDDAVDAKEASEEAARKAAAASVHAPIIQNGFWYIWSDDQYVNTNVRAEGEKGDKGDTGEKGDAGNGIESITKTGTSGLVDTYTVTYTDGTSSTFTVTNGAKGDKGDTGATGNGIASIEKTGTSGNVDTYTITYTNGQTVTFTVTNGAVSSVAGKTGAVVLDSGDIEYDGTETYQNGTAGAALSELNRQLSDLEDTISTTQIINTASGAIASFSDGADGMPIKKLVAQIEPVQDLHGYENPWPAGGGVNLLFVDSRVSQKTAGVTYTSDDDFIYLNGTKNGGSYVTMAALTLTLQAGTYYAKAFAIGGTAANNPSVYPYDGSADLCGNIFNDEKSFTLEAEKTFYIRFAVWSDGTVFTNYKIGIVISKTSGIDKFYTYSNECPISGHTGAEIYDDPAYGGTIRWNQLLKELSLSNPINWVVFGGTGTVADDVCNVTLTAPIANLGSRIDSKTYYDSIAGHKYYITFGIKTPKAITGLRIYYDAHSAVSETIATTNSWVRVSKIVTPSTGYTNAYAQVFFGNIATDGFAVGDVISVKNFMLCDLTAMFGAGNEPTTTAEFEALFNRDYYAYNTGEETTASAVNGDEYNQISVTFPTTIYGGEDEVISGKLKSTMGMVDLGTLNWTLMPNDKHLFYAAIPGIKPNGIPNVAANIKSDRYKTVSASAAFGATQDCVIGQGITGIIGNVYIMVVNRAYSDAASFKTAMSGAQLCYELAEPVEYTLTGNEMETIYGTNNIWSSTGDTEVTYPADTKLYIDNKITQAIANALNS